MPLIPPVTSSDHVIGPDDAAMTLVEFGDYECPYCAKAHAIVQDLIDELGGELRYVYRNYPLVQIHPHALRSALVAEAARGDRFWVLHDVLYGNQDSLDDASLIDYAGQVGVPEERAEEALGGSTVDKVRADVESGQESGVRGTPTFFINGRRHEGEWTHQALLQALLAARVA